MYAMSVVEEMEEDDLEAGSGVLMVPGCSGGRGGQGHVDDHPMDRLATTMDDGPDPSRSAIDIRRTA